MMERRAFLKLLSLAPVAPTVFSFGTGVWMPEAMTPVKLAATNSAWREGLLDLFFLNVPPPYTGPVTATELERQMGDLLLAGITFPPRKWFSLAEAARSQAAPADYPPPAP